jgi:hypothetical protein
MSRRSRDASNIVKFPIGRVVREHRSGLIVGETSEEAAIEQSLGSMRRAITTLRRQESTLFLAWYRAQRNRTPEQQRRFDQLADESLRRTYARIAEDEAEQQESGDGDTAA